MIAVFIRHENKIKLWDALISKFVLYDPRHLSFRHSELDRGYL
jgi:hypothetical protein